LSLCHVHVQALEDKHIEEKEVLRPILKSLDKIFSVIFMLEMLLKISAFGIAKYFTDAWCWLDFIIVSVSCILSSLFSRISSQ
jgi:Ion transport protein